MWKWKVITGKVYTVQMVKFGACMTKCKFGSIIYSSCAGVAFSFFSRQRRVTIQSVCEKIQEFTSVKSSERECRLMALITEPINTPGFEA